MITITIKLENEYDSKYEKISISKEDLLQLACNKAKGEYMEGYWTKISANDEIEIKTSL